MTTPNDHDRFDHALRGAICEGAPETAPADLRARVTTALEARPGQPWTRSSAWLLGAAAGVAALLVVAIAWPRITHGPGASAGRSASLPTADGTQPGTAFPTRTGLSLGELVDHPGEVQSGQLITSTDGVVTNTDGRVLMTATGGTTWRDITPGNAGEQAVLRLFFLDPDRGWIVTFDPTAVTGIVVWRTVDGGRSWDETAIPALRSVNWDLEMLS
ncbi:MAG TPA: hypothetical protein VFI15_03160, partial [Candidatus Limnocylindrales bacterium]|nr:hypothetical protein [Candidatus Limnocylindrales bacterium]